jgi:hypothetical protein
MSAVALKADPVPMTDEQRFVFDLKGWIVLPGVLEPGLLSEIQRYLFAVIAAKGPAGGYARHSLSGPAQELIDHPAIVGVLREIVGPDPSDDSYGFRCESSFFIERRCGEAGFLPAHTGPLLGPLAYRVSGGTIWSGLTRVIWELTGVDQPEGGTAIMSGSHKSNFTPPPALRTYDASLYEGYTCPPGSAVIMSENCWHYGVNWTNPRVPRLAVFNCYNSYIAQWHRMNLPPHVIESMPARRRTAFRGVWGRDVKHERNNDYFAADNCAL